MYQAHFKLDKRLFDDGVAADAAVFRSPQHDQLIEQFKLALASSTAIVLLRGPAGVGKSTLTATALRASSTRLALAWINSTPSNGAELVELVLAELGVSAQRASRIERLQLWRQYQAEMAATDSRLFVVVERTEDLPAEVLHTLDSLTAADAAGHPGANVVLLGHQGLEAHLTVPVLDSFRQRIRLRAELKPFSEAELQDYLRHQVACAGGAFDRLFAPGTVAALHRYSRGVARLCNNLCETALAIAATRAQPLLTPQLVTEAAVQWLGLGETPAPAAQPTAAPNVAASFQMPTAPAGVSATPVITPAPVAPPTPAARPAPVAPAPVVAPTPVAAPPPFVARAAAAAAPPTPPPATVTARPQPPATAPPPSPKPAPAVVAPTPATPASVARAPALDVEFDGGQTDVSEIELVDFPVLTDAVESEPLVVKRASAPPPAAPSVANAAAPPTARPAPPPPRAVPPPAPEPAKRVEPAYVAPKGPPPAVAPPTSPAATAAAARPTATAPPKPAPPAAPPKPVAASPTPPPAPQRPAPAPTEDEDDVERQTQTMRAISAAKSIDDVSDSMAETLFGDAELDLMSAALATAASMAEDDEPTSPAPPKAAPKAAAPATKPAPAKPASARPASSDDDLIDLLGLSDAPLELIDDSTPSSADRQKNAGRR